MSRPTYPISNIYGFDRGIPIDRYYIDKFLQENKSFIKGHCLEILNDSYTKKYGGFSVTKSDVLDINMNNKDANIHGDLRNLENIPDEKYDCIILTQVLQFIDDYEKAISEVRRILKTGGVLLATLPSMSRIDVAAGLGNDFWRLTPAGARFVFLKYFEDRKLNVKGYGNASAGLGFWVGLAQEDTRKTSLDFNDPNFPIIVSIKAIK